MTSYLLRVPRELKDVLRRRAERMGLSLNALILQILWEYAGRAV